MFDKGQQAMAVALAYPDPAKLNRGSFATKDQDVSSGSLSKARTVLRDRQEQKRKAEAKGGGPGNTPSKGRAPRTWRGRSACVSVQKPKGGI
jgi:hypothetical protein